MGWKTKLSVLLGIYLCFACAMAYYSRISFPIRPGTSSDFWFGAVGVAPGPVTTPGWGIYQTDDDWFVYYVQGFHGQFLYRVSKADAKADLPEIVKRLDQAKLDDVSPFRLEAFREWKRRDPSHSDAELLIHLNAEYWLKELQRDAVDQDGNKKDWKTYLEERQEAFDYRYARTNRYWLNILFESAFLAALILFGLWPWLLSKSSSWWGVHVGALPFLFFLPYYLGYAPFCFTSAGPVGGVLYPHLLFAFRNSPIPWNDLDRWTFRQIPHPLSILTQDTGPMLSLSGGGGSGPIGTLFIGGMVGISIALLPFAIRLARELLKETQRRTPTDQKH
jgi:hypothetical protein